MGQYSLVERKFAAVLDRFPGLKRSIKSAYQRANYHAFADPGFTYEVDADVEMMEFAEHFSTTNRADEQFFGYFDTTPWNDPMDAAVVHESPRTDRVEVVLYRDGSRERLTTTAAWNYQQGSRAQWHPTREDRILLNDVDREGAHAKAVDLSGECLTTYTRPLQAVDPTGEDYLSLNYRRLDRNRADYGYGLSDGSNLESPARDGLWLVDLGTGVSELIIALESLIEATNATGGVDYHYVNHAVYGPTGARFVFMHRWRSSEGRKSRLYVADRSGDRELLMDGVVSHYCWLNESALFVWGESDTFGAGYHVVDVDTGNVSYVDPIDDWGDGHPSLSPDGQYVVTDTYPDRERNRHLLLYDRRAETVTTIGRFFEPLAYSDVTRCDLHPRWSPDGNLISIDSAHAGTRKSYVLDVGELLD